MLVLCRTDRTNFALGACVELFASRDVRKNVRCGSRCKIALMNDEGVSISSKRETQSPWHGVQRNLIATLYVPILSLIGCFQFYIWMLHIRTVPGHLARFCAANEI